MAISHRRLTTPGQELNAPSISAPVYLPTFSTHRLLSQRPLCSHVSLLSVLNVGIASLLL